MNGRKSVALGTVAASGLEGVSDDKSWERVDSQANKLSRLVRDLRKLAELETRPLERERVDLEQLLRDAIDAVGQQYPDAAPRLNLAVTRVPWPVPPVSADPDLVAVAIDNVLANAVKFSAGGVIEVADAGRGIPAEELPQVFDEFARARNARDVPGSGIGLSLANTIVRRHGGSASVRSAEGSGAVITLRLRLGAHGE